MNKLDIHTLLLPIGSPTLASYLDYIRKNKLLVLFPITGGPQFRSLDLKGIIHYRATYSDEVHALIDYLADDYSIRKFAFFYQDDAYGIGAVKAAHAALKAHNITEWTDVPYNRAAMELDKQAQMIKEASPEAIGFFSTSHAAEELIRRVGVTHLGRTQLFGISFLDEDPFRQFIKTEGLKVIFSSVVPNPSTSKLPIVEEYRTAFSKYKYFPYNHFTYNRFSLEGYIATSILIDALQHIKQPITREKIEAYLESLDNYKFKGITLTFNPKTRSFARYVWIVTEEDKPWTRKSIEPHEK